MNFEELSKDKALMDCGEYSDPPQREPCGMRKGENKRDDLSLTDDVQETGEKCYRSPLQKSTIFIQVDQTTGESTLGTPDADQETPPEESDVRCKKEKTAECPGYFQLESLCMPCENDTNENENDNHDVRPEQSGRPPLPECTDQNQVPLQVDEPFVTILEERLGGGANSQQDSECNKLAGHYDPGDMCAVEVKEADMEATAKTCSSRKRSMDACGLTEKERNIFLHENKRKRRHDSAERVENQICNTNAGLRSSSSSPSSPRPITVADITEPREGEINPQSRSAVAVDRDKTEGHVGISTPDRADTTCEPCCPGRECEAGGSLLPDDGEQTDYLKTDPSTAQDAGCLGNPDQKVCPVKYSEPLAEAIGREQGDEVTMATGDREGEKVTDAVSDGAGPCTPTTNNQQELNCGSVEPCTAAAISHGLQKKGSSSPKNESGSYTSGACSDSPQTCDAADLSSVECLADASDLQLNTRITREAEQWDKTKGGRYADRGEDASDLICGLIRELASLNRVVMGASRELDNLRHGSKT